MNKRENASSPKEIRKAVWFYYDMGFSVLPLKRTDPPSKENKRPNLDTWKWLYKKRASREQISQWLDEGRFQNIGIILGEVSGNLVALDFDDENVVSDLDMKLDKVVRQGFWVADTRGTNRCQIYMKDYKDPGSIKKKLKLHIEKRANQGYVVAPPSIHPNGHKYRFIGISKLDDLKPLPTIDVDKKYWNPIIKKLRKKRGIKPKKKARRRGEGRADPNAPPPCIETALEGVDEGGRHDVAFGIASWYYHKCGLSIKEIIPKLKDWNEKNNPPFTSNGLGSELKKIKDVPEYRCGCDWWDDRGMCPFDDKKECPFFSKKERKETDRYSNCFVKNDKLYLEIKTKDGSYKFAYLKNGQVEFVDHIDDHQGVVIKPRFHPKKEGEIVEIVKMPSDGISDCELLAPTKLFGGIVEHLKKYVDLPEINLKLCAFYILFTWFYRKVNTVGYLRLLADTGKGKSRILDVTGDLCFYPIIASGASSFSGMMRINNRWHGTLIMDESDIRGGKTNQVIKFLNLGFQKGKYFILSDKQNPKNQEYFDPFSTKIIAMREPFNDSATEGRVLSISPHETTDPDIPILLGDEYEKEAMELRNKIARFVLEYWPKVDGKKMMSFRGIDVEPRLKQLSMPLSIIFQIWEEGKPVFIDYIKKRQKEIKKIRAQSYEGSMFNYVYSVAISDETLGERFDGYYLPDTDQIQAIIPSMVAKTFKTTAKTVTQTLTSIGFDVETNHITYYKKIEEGEYEEKRKTIRAYVVKNDRTWREIIQRYYYSEDDKDCNPDIEIPEILKSKRFVCVNKTVPSVPSVPLAKFGTVGTVGTLTRTHADKIKRIEQHYNETKDDEGFANIKETKSFMKHRLKIDDVDKFWDKLVGDGKHGHIIIYPNDKYKFREIKIEKDCDGNESNKTCGDCIYFRIPNENENHGWCKLKRKQVRKDDPVCDEFKRKS